MQNLLARDGEVYYLPGFVGPESAGILFERLRAGLDWREEDIVVAGREVKVPRLVCWHGDEGAVYRYSGVDHLPLPWTDELLDIKARIEQCCGRGFNSALCNLYRDGSDSMGWHADKEKELGRDPYIASLSLGAERLFRLRHDRSGETLDVPLGNGALLLMGGSLQHHWRHCVPKSKGIASARINLTFRMIVHPKRQAIKVE
jgi:alkylated DNA repair dioxygenase AlkB